MKLINIGFGNMVSASRLIAIVSPESAPIKRIIQDAKDKEQQLEEQRDHLASEKASLSSKVKALTFLVIKELFIRFSQSKMLIDSFNYNEDLTLKEKNISAPHVSPMKKKKI